MAYYYGGQLICTDAGDGSRGEFRAVCGVLDGDGALCWFGTIDPSHSSCAFHPCGGRRLGVASSVLGDVGAVKRGEWDWGSILMPEPWRRAGDMKMEDWR